MRDGRSDLGGRRATSLKSGDAVRESSGERFGFRDYFILPVDCAFGRSPLKSAGAATRVGLIKGESILHAVRAADALLQTVTCDRVFCPLPATGDRNVVGRAVRRLIPAGGLRFLERGKSQDLGRCGRTGQGQRHRVAAPLSRHRVAACPPAADGPASCFCTVPATQFFCRSSQAIK